MVAVVSPRKPQLIDLTHELSPDFPVYPWFQRLNFTILAREQRGDFWMEYNFISTVEHVGTHMDAPAHFSRGSRRIHQIPIQRFVGPGVVIKVAEKVHVNQIYQVSVDDNLEWEARNGRVPCGAIVMVDSGWTRRVQTAETMFGTDDPNDRSTYRTTSISPAAARFLQRRQVSLVGVDTISVDGGNSTEFLAHRALLPHGVMVVENVANLDQVPEAGALIYCMPLKLREGSGSPIRAFAVIIDDVMLHTDTAPEPMSALCVSWISLIMLAYKIFIY